MGLSFDPIAEARRQWLRRWEAAEPMAAATSIMRAQQIVLARVDAMLRPFELTFARYEALVLLSFTRTGALPLGKMGVRLMVHPTSVTNTVNRLEAQGFVRRVPHPTSNRCDARSRMACRTRRSTIIAASHRGSSRSPMPSC